jgi:hypothetical protein
MPSKITPFLTHKLDSSSPWEMVAVEVAVKAPLSAAQRAAIQGLGLSIGTEVSNVFTCRGPASAVKALENLDFVTSIDSGTVELS